MRNPIDIVGAIVDNIDCEIIANSITLNVNNTFTIDTCDTKYATIGLDINGIPIINVTDTEIVLQSVATQPFLLSKPKYYYGTLIELNKAINDIKQIPEPMQMAYPMCYFPEVRNRTKEFLNRNALVKWDRIANVDANTVENIKNKARADLSNSNPKFAEAAAILLIIAHTGLRVGQTAGFEKTGNMGVSTLGVDNLNINKSGDINFEFIGKSYKNNTGEITGEPELSAYLKKLKATRIKSEHPRLFSMDRTFVDKIFKNKYGFKNLKIKDMRTYVATDLGNKTLQEHTSQVKEQLTGDIKKDRRLVVATLANMYKIVSQKLNNTPKMAETAYVHPIVRKQWLNTLGLSEDLLKAVDYIDTDYMPLDDIITYNTVQTLGIDIDEDDEE